MLERRRPFLVLATAGLLLMGGASTAFLLRSRHEVTTSSDAAYRFYVKGRENDLKLYDREAKEAYAAALAEDPHFVMATLRLAGRLRGKDPERARALLETAERAADGVTPREAMYLKIFRAELDKDREALDALLDEYVKRFPGDPEGYNLRAERMFASGRSEEGVRQLQRLLEIDPNQAFAYNSLGYYYAALGQNEKAEEQFLRYRFLAPDQANPHDSLGELYANIGRYDDAERSLKTALSVKPDFFPVYGHLGTMAVGRGDYVKAADYFRKVVELSDGEWMRFEFSIAALSSLAFAGRTNEALLELDRAIAGLRSSRIVDEKQVDLQDATLRCYVLLLAGRTDEADARLTQVRELLAKAGNLPAGKLQDFEANATLLSAGILAQRGRLEEAADSYAKVFCGESESRGKGFPYFDHRAFVRVAYAEVLEKLGRAEDAKAALQPILRRNPKFFAAAEVAKRLPG